MSSKTTILWLMHHVMVMHACIYPYNGNMSVSLNNVSGNIHISLNPSHVVPILASCPSQWHVRWFVLQDIHLPQVWQWLCCQKKNSWVVHKHWWTPPSAATNDGWMTRLHFHTLARIMWDQHTSPIVHILHICKICKFDASRRCIWNTVSRMCAMEPDVC